MPFDVIMFNGGLKSSGIPSKIVGGYQHYKIMHLNHLLGQNWHVRGINSGGDYGYVVLDTVNLYLRRNRSLVEYICSQNGPEAHSIDTGYSLIFSFVFNYGSSDTFGKDDTINHSNTYHAICIKLFYNEQCTIHYNVQYIALYVYIRTLNAAYTLYYIHYITSP